ncbi:iron ABC transporter permease [Neptunomonas sp. XY-337]|uniref:FecCD family ABC transporter permease n=1 Tax=Neptunomonas sp. XY-337 TaxID=2561897 RepID=UPI0010A99759|nr:iron ABC transporter permease [Neptunomonas sp. XY-337]
MQIKIPYSWLMAILVALVLLLFSISISIGHVWLNPLDALWSGAGSISAADHLILTEIRLPRAVLGLLIGAALGLSGATLQGLLRNPLAEPGLLGISASASLGAVLAIYTGLSAAFAYALPISALLGALVAVVLLRALAGKSADILTIILSGVALTSLAAALTSLTLNMSSNPFAALEIVFWMLGSLADRSWMHVGMALPFILLGSVLLLATARALDALSLGQDVARSMGVNLNRTNLLAIFGTALSVGAATAVSGAIGFVGLVVPHLLRPLVGNRPSHLLPASALGGAAFLLLADIAVRFVFPDKDLKLGVITALVGAPFFFWLLHNVKKRTQL